MFVDNSGRRSKVLRRFGLLLGVACLGYAVVLGAAFMGWGTSLSPSSLLPFGGGNGGGGGQGPGGLGPAGGRGGVVPSGGPSGVPTARPVLPNGAASPTAVPSASAAAAAG